ncbi:MAG: PAS domain-containing protein [Chromatiales bacterium]|nr:PAS domain-containing protein [Chromatiales bacterium]
MNAEPPHPADNEIRENIVLRHALVSGGRQGLGPRGVQRAHLGGRPRPGALRFHGGRRNLPGGVPVGGASRGRRPASQLGCRRLPERMKPTWSYRIVLPDAVRLQPSGATGKAVDSTGLYIIGVSVDITLEEACRPSIGRPWPGLEEAAVESTGIGFHVSEDEGRITLLDDRTRAMFGFPPELEARVRAFWLEHVHPDDRDARGPGEPGRQ